MNAKKPASGITLKSDLERLDAYVPKAEDYAELPEVTEDMLRRGVVKRAGRLVETSLHDVRYSTVQGEPA